MNMIDQMEVSHEKTHNRFWNYNERRRCKHGSEGAKSRNPETGHGRHMIEQKSGEYVQHESLDHILCTL